MPNLVNFAAGLDEENFEESPQDIFLRACVEGNSECVEKLLSAQVVNISSMSTTMESSPLYIAASNYNNDEAGHKKIIELLLQNGANPLINNIKGSSIAEKIIRDSEYQHSHIIIRAKC